MNIMRLASIGVPVLLFLLMAFAVAETEAWQSEGAGGAEDIDEIVQDIFTEHLVAFEVLGVLLTAAMIGALVIARPMVSGLDSDHYPRADDEQLEKTQSASDLTATFKVTPLVPAATPLAARRAGAPQEALPGTPGASGPAAGAPAGAATTPAAGGPTASGGEEE